MTHPKFIIAMDGYFRLGIEDYIVSDELKIEYY